MSQGQHGKTLRIANCSGFYGDRLSAAQEMVEGGPIDVLTGDYLAELTLMILHKDRLKDPSLGYAKTFLLQLQQIAKTCLERGIKIVVNAGGLNPAGCADACRQVYQQLGLEARVAHLEGDDLLPRLDDLQTSGEALRHLDKDIPLAALDAPVVSANAYLGGWGIAQALELGADLVICPRVTDAALVMGPAAWRFGWARDDWNRLASAVVAGHILECGAQATGGNYSFFLLDDTSLPPGFPIAEMSEDGSFVVTKHPGTGGLVSVGTVTEQLLYESQGARYLGPDVTARFDSIQLTAEGRHRVRVSGVQGEPPPAASKVCLNYAGGFRNRVTFLLNGLHIREKRLWLEDALWRRLGGRESFDDVRVSLHHAAPQDIPSPDPEDGVRPDVDGGIPDPDGIYSLFTVSVKDRDPKKVGRRFSAAAVELALASYPGFNLTAPPGKETPFGVYWPALVSRDAIEQQVVFEGETYPVAHPPLRDHRVDAFRPSGVERWEGTSSTTERPLGQIVGARSGDKGGNANVGLWVMKDPAYAWLMDFLTVERLRELLPQAADVPIERHVLPNLRALNFILHGFLGDGVASSLALDAQAKGLGEHLRAQIVPLPDSILY